MSAFHRSHRQPLKGLGFSHFLIGIIVVMAFLVPLGRSIPTIKEYWAIKQAVRKASFATNAAEAKSIFEKQAVIDSITTLSADDLLIDEMNGAINIRFDYKQPVPLYGNLSLLIRYQGSASNSVKVD